MSVAGTQLLFEGFLQKRKDTLKLRWATYWFRLHNTTLFFYTKRNGSASHLRSYYYMYTVQSVREVQKPNGKPFMFEIIMKNGKRKMLAAETAALRKQWLGQLWEAMHLSACKFSESRDTRPNSGTTVSTQTDSVTELLSARQVSAPTPSVQIQCEATSVASPICSPQQRHNALPDCNHRHRNGDSLSSPQLSSGICSAEDRLEGDYDVLPLRKRIGVVKIATQMNEVVYDTPLPYKRSAKHLEPAENIYDIPSSLLKNTSDQLTEEQHEDSVYWRI